jgi:hypothetical protein
MIVGDGIEADSVVHFNEQEIEAAFSGEVIRSYEFLDLFTA